MAGLVATLAATAQDTPKPGRTKAGRPKAQLQQNLVKAHEASAKAAFTGNWESRSESLHRDFPDLCLDGEGRAWVLYIENDGTADTLRLGWVQGTKVESIAKISSAGVLHQPALARDGDGLWCVWGQVDSRDVMTLRARRFQNGQLGDEITLSSSGASDSFADAATDPAGRVWVAWQSLRRGQGDIFTRFYDPGTKEWSKEMAVSPHEGGNWEPRLAFSDDKGAWVAYDSSRSGNFNLQLAHVSTDGKVEDKALTNSDEYEARAAVTYDGKSALWIAGERGRRQWGMEQRGHEADTGFNGQRKLLVGRYDLQAGTFTELPLYDNGRPAPIPMPSPGFNVNVPSVATDAAGNPWIAYRVCDSMNWRVALLKYDVSKGQWCEPVEVEDSSMGQDRHNELTRAADGSLWLCWPTDGRVRKECGTGRVHVARLNTSSALKLVPGDGNATVSHLPQPAPYASLPAQDRPRSEHHVWKIGGKTYRLVWGDLHRHTDISNCRTGADGCILEHFRYAYDCAALDFMGTSDHTDVGKMMHPYEWWHTQRMVDALYAPGKFTSLYAYEREQPYPWGHRNVVFAQRGGPVVYLSRQTYRASPWQDALGVKAGIGQITPMELWDVLSRYGKPVALISHTGATGMGTDWDKYDQIDGRFENTVEIFQGARVSYEGKGAPQPTIGLREGDRYTADTASKAVIPAPPAAIEDFGAERNNGLYQRALTDGHKLGVFASSDHISQHCSFGGVYVEEGKLNREGIIAGLKARRSVAATDKIFIELSIDGHPMGEIVIAKGKPTLQLAVNATAPLKRVTIVRNEQDWKVLAPGTDPTRAEATLTDDAPPGPEARYYLRVEQSDGSMGWSSPIWLKASE